MAYAREGEIKMSAGNVVTLACDKCGHSAEFELTEEQSRKRRAGSVFRCSRCKGKGRVIARVPMRERQQSVGIECDRCRELLSGARLRAMPGTRICVACASSDAEGEKRKFTKDSFGSREDFKRDRGSWRR
jgi:Prokaryotic dksA/traR C4-type zinc finger